MKTRNTSYRCTEAEHEGLEKRAAKQGIGVSALVSRTLSFFGRLEEISYFWDELFTEAKRRKTEPEILMVDMLEKIKSEPVPTEKF